VRKEGASIVICLTPAIPCHFTSITSLLGNMEV